MDRRKISRRRVLKGLLPFAFLVASAAICGDDYKTRRNKKLKRRGDDKHDMPDDPGKHSGDDYK